MDKIPLGFHKSVFIRVHPWLKIQTPIAPIVHPQMNSESEFPSVQRRRCVIFVETQPKQNFSPGVAASSDDIAPDGA
jgi:hypothetical protein